MVQYISGSNHHCQPNYYPALGGAPHGSTPLMDSADYVMSATTPDHRLEADVESYQAGTVWADPWKKMTGS